MSTITSIRATPNSATTGTTMAPAGVARWRQFGLVFQWQLRRNLTLMPLYVVVQLVLSVATVVGYGLLIGDPAPDAARYLVTGAPTISLVMLGLAMTPQFVAQSRTEGSLDWMRALPISRPVFLLADLAVWTMVALPGLVLSIIVGALRVHLDLSMSWLIVPAALLIALTSASIGYAIANLCPPTLAQLISQVLVFVILLFSPLSYPADRLPQWGQAVHHWLPLESMGEIMRHTILSADFAAPLSAWLLLAAWCAAAVAGASWALGRRS